MEMRFVKPLWKHQMEGLNEAIRVYEEAKALPHPEMQQAGYALFYEPRVGKTPVAINMLRYLCNRNKARLRTLILCPPRVIQGWKREFEAHSKFPPEHVVLLKGSGERRLKLLKQGVVDGAHIFITNYESLLLGPLFEALASYKLEFLVLDESHRLKDKKAKRSKRAEFLANPREATWDEGKQRFVMKRNGAKYAPPYKMDLTGSAILGSIMDLYWQFRILDGGETFSYYDYMTRKNEPMTESGFRLTYFTDLNRGMPKAKYFPKWELKTLKRDGFDSLAEVAKRIRHKSMRVERKDVLELPKNEFVTIEIDLSQEQKKLYSEMKRDFITWYKQEAVVARLALTKSIRLLQITSGFVKTEDGQEKYLDENPKKEALKELLEDLLPSGKVIIWSVFKENYRQIREVCESLRARVVEVNGEISSSQQDRNIVSFKTDPTCRVLSGHPESGGEGLNLVEARYIIFYSRNHSVKHWIQGWARNQSQDSTHENTTTYSLVARGTVDQLAAEHVQSNEKMADEVYANLVIKNILENDCNLDAG